MLLVIGPRQFSFSSASHSVPSCLCVLKRVFLGCADVTCTAAIVYKGFASCRSRPGRQLSHPGGCLAHFLHQNEPSLCAHPLARISSPDPHEAAPVIDAEMQIAQLPGAQYFQGENSRQPLFALGAVSNHLGCNGSIFSCGGFF